MNIKQLIDDILRREGGFVDHEDDRGGATAFAKDSDTTLKLFVNHAAEGV